MNLDAAAYFEIVLAGFVTVWTYRHFSKSKIKISEFEYLGWSAFWGLILLTGLDIIITNYPKREALLNNPFATGLILSILGLVGGTIAGFELPAFLNWLKKKTKNNKINSS